MRTWIIVSSHLHVTITHMACISFPKPLFLLKRYTAALSTTQACCLAVTWLIGEKVIQGLLDVRSVQFYLKMIAFSSHPFGILFGVHQVAPVWHLIEKVHDSYYTPCNTAPELQFTLLHDLNLFQDLLPRIPSIHKPSFCFQNSACLTLPDPPRSIPFPGYPDQGFVIPSWTYSSPCCARDPA